MVVALKWSLFSYFSAIGILPNMKRILTMLVLLCVIGMSFSGIANATGNTYTRSIYFDTVCYCSSADTFPVNAGQDIKISWTSGRTFSIYLRNNTTGNITSFKQSSSSVTYTGMRTGDYTLLASDMPDDNNECFTQTFTISVTD